MLYAEDLTPGRTFEFGSRTLSKQDIIDFARQWDPLPIHVDSEHAKAGPFGEVIASGLHTLAVYQRMMVDAFGYDVAHKAGRQLVLNFRRPVRPGTTLRGRCHIVEVTLRPERLDASMRMHAHVLDQNDNVVLEVDMEGIVLMRPTAS
jgi:acyl dehydratase